MSKACESFEAKCRAFWEEADPDGNGITHKELVKILQKVSTVEINTADVAEIFVDMDDDGDKILSWEEFSDVFRKKDPKKVQQSELKAAFMEIDRDGSGGLSPAEIRAQYDKLGIQISDDAFNATIDTADKDDDGRINYDEFLKVWSQQS